MTNIKKTLIALLASTLIAMPISNAYAFMPAGIKMAMEGDTLVVTKSSDGYFYIPVYINAKPILLEVDTAAGEVILNQEDTIALGLGSSKITDTQTFTTGNGKITIKGTRAVVQVGNAMFSNVKVYANPYFTGRSVIGMSLLTQFHSVVFNNNGIRIQP